MMWEGSSGNVVLSLRLSTPRHKIIIKRAQLNIQNIASLQRLYTEFVILDISAIIKTPLLTRMFFSIMMR